MNFDVHGTGHLLPYVLRWLLWSLTAFGTAKVQKAVRPSTALGLLVDSRLEFVSPPPYRELNAKSTCKYSIPLLKIIGHEESVLVVEVKSPPQSSFGSGTASLA